MQFVADSRGEVCVIDATRVRVEWRRIDVAPKSLARRYIQQAAGDGWFVQGRSPFVKLRETLGAYTYYLRRRNQESGEEDLQDVIVVFPISSEVLVYG